jgi:hypothetical protein
VAAFPGSTAPSLAADPEKTSIEQQEAAFRTGPLDITHRNGVAAVVGR